MRNALLLTLILTGCPPGDKVVDSTGDSAPSGPYAVLTTAALDFSTGAFATVALEDWSVSDERFVVAGDAAVAVDEGVVYQLNRYGYDTLRAYEPGRWSAPMWEVALGDLSNPYDAEVCAGQLFVSLYGDDVVGVYDPQDGSLLGQVDLSAFADGDSKGPEANALVEVNGRLYLGMNRLNRAADWSDAGGRVAELDCEALEVTRSWEVGGNTVVHPWPGTDKLLVTARAYGEQPGGLYAIDPADGALSRVVETDSIGHQLTGVAAQGDRAVLISSASDGSGYGLHCLDIPEAALSTAEETAEYLIDAATSPDGQAWIAAHWGWLDPDNALAGTLVYDIERCESLTAGERIRTSLAPVSLDFVSP